MSKRLRRPTARQTPALQPPASIPDAGRSEGRPPLHAPDAGRRDAGPFDPLAPAPPSAPAPGGAGPASGTAPPSAADDDANAPATTGTAAIVGAEHSAARAEPDDTPGAECFAPASPAANANAAPAAAAAGPGNADDADDARRRSFYQQFFNTDETALIAAFHRNPTPEDELWLQRVMNRRLLARVPAEGPPKDEGRTTDPAERCAAGGEGRTRPKDAGQGTNDAAAKAKAAAAKAKTKDTPPPDDPGADADKPASESQPSNCPAPPAPSPDEELKGLVWVAQQINAGTGRVAALLRDVRALGLEDWEKPPQAVQAAARELGPARDWGGKP